MTPEEEKKLSEIRAKIIADIDLTREEDIFYLVHELKHTPEEAERILFIQKESGPGRIID
jgi:hypothetical protein